MLDALTPFVPKPTPYTSVFPPGATIGQSFYYNGIFYSYDGTKWVASSSSGGTRATFVVDQFGARGDCQFFTGTLTIGAGGSPVVTIGTATLNNVIAGQLAVLPLGGAGVGGDAAGSGGLKGTVSAVNAGASQITITPLTGFTPTAI